jgi:tetratricopeptide (TPR) repeat protein
MSGRVLLTFSLFVSSVFAQLDAGSTMRRVKVRVAFVNGGCDASTYVTLMGRNGPAAQGIANDQCEVEFVNVPVGTYHLAVSGQNFADTETGPLIMNSGSADLEVEVKRKGEPERTNGAPVAPLISATDLGIPSGAKKEFDKANQLTEQKNFPKAIKELNKAIALYPAYAGAYNNLGVIYARLGDRSREREALEKALSINDRFAPAYVNLGRMNITAGDYPNAEIALSKAHAFDPNDALTMVLLTFVEFVNRHFDEAIATSRQAHSLSQGSHAFAHQVAARALEQQQRMREAVVELELFLKEEPSGPRAEIARKELSALQSNPH